MEAQLGIDKQKTELIVGNLSKLLADSYTLYLKTHNFHWNVTGAQFRTLHLMFEEQYNELALAVDAIAERIRSLGAKAPGSYKEFSKLTAIEEAESALSANEMLTDLLLGHEIIVRSLREMFSPASEAGDEATLDILTQRITTHEKTAWMLRSMIE